LFANVARLLRETRVTIHLDLVAGLPGEDFTGFTASLQRLLAATPHHIQVEPLKILKGAPMRKIANANEYAWSATPPYRILRTPWLSFEEICRIETIGNLLETFYNTGRFRNTFLLLAETQPLAEIFVLLADFWKERGNVWDKSQKGLFEAFWSFAAELVAETEKEALRETLSVDYCLVEYPSPARAPGFFTLSFPASQTKAAIPPEIAARAMVDSAQVRTFTASFSRDYRAIPRRNEPVSLTFYYLAAPGKGLSVLVQEG
jgi:anaerobic magnesium-protoporphyrin IX monomethyl ester cyclase